MTYNYSSTAGEYSLSGSINASATSVTLNSVTGLPAPPFKVVINPGEVNEEIVKVTAVGGTTLTVVRGWDSSAAVSHDAPAKVRHMMTAEDLRLSRQHEAATSAHGVSGAVVGTSDAQTLTNKNLTAGTNTFPTSLATLTGTQVLSNKDLTAATNTFPASLATTAALDAHRFNTSAAHGVTGAVVGTTNTQTLTNKTLDNPTVTGTMAAAAASFSGSVTVGGSALADYIKARAPQVVMGSFATPTLASGALHGEAITFASVGTTNYRVLFELDSTQVTVSVSTAARTATGCTVNVRNMAGGSQAVVVRWVVLAPSVS